MITIERNKCMICRREMEEGMCIHTECREAWSQWRIDYDRLALPYGWGVMPSWHRPGDRFGGRP